MDLPWHARPRADRVDVDEAAFAPLVRRKTRDAAGCSTTRGAYLAAGRRTPNRRRDVTGGSDAGFARIPAGMHVGENHDELVAFRA